MKFATYRIHRVLLLSLCTVLIFRLVQVPQQWVNQDVLAASDAPKPDSSAAKPVPDAIQPGLIAQLREQESAAAMLAEKIRQLQANGAAEKNQQQILDEQRQLQTILGTAFDLKLQLEELQVKELQSRLSRLERQIGQRKELREKIIARRAGELLDNDPLRWDSSKPTRSDMSVSTVGQNSPSATSASSPLTAPVKADQIVVDLYSGSEVMPRIRWLPLYRNLIHTLNSLEDVSTNVEAVSGSIPDVIAVAIVHDPSRISVKKPELKTAIDAALKNAKVAIRWEGVIDAVAMESTNSQAKASNSEPNVEKAASTYKVIPSTPNDKNLLDELLAVLKDDNDPQHIAPVLHQLGKMELGDNAERVATAILAMMEYQDPFSYSSSTSFVYEIMKTISRSVKVPVLIKAVRDGHPRVKSVAIWSVINEQSLWEYGNEPEFPQFVELLLSTAADSEALPRAAALTLLANTLPLTKIDPANLSTEERRDAVRRLITAAPPERVQQLIITALSDENGDVAQTASHLLMSIPEQWKDPQLLAQLVDVLAKVAQGHIQPTNSNRWYRGQALDDLTKLRRQAAPAVPQLIELLKSDDPEFTAKKDSPLQHEREQFTREKVIQALGAIGSAAKDALPILEAELVLLDAKAKEDALLSGATDSRFQGRPESVTAARLRTAISNIKGERSNGSFGRESQ